MKILRLFFIVASGFLIYGAIDQLLGRLDHFLDIPLAIFLVVEVLAVLLGIAVALALHRRLSDRIEPLRNWLGISLVAGATLQLAYTLYRGGSLPHSLYEIWAGTSLGAIYALAAGTLAMLWWYSPKKKPVQDTLRAADRSFDRLHFLGSIFGYFVFRVSLIAAASFGLYYAWTWVPVQVPSGRPDNAGLAIVALIWNIDAVRVAVGLLLVALIAISLWDLWRLLIGSISRDSALESEKAHGDARNATQVEARRAASGNISSPPWAKHGYRD